MIIIGFGSLTRHLPRLTEAVTDALKYNCLDKENLSFINFYNPGISSQWMLQRAMSLRKGTQYDEKFINHLLGENFKAMGNLGEPILKPFLQDIVQFIPMGVTMLTQVSKEPLFIPRIIQQVGVLPIVFWLYHYLSLGMFTAAYQVLRLLEGQNLNTLPTDLRFKVRRTIEGVKYGAGLDYHFN